MAPRIRSLGIWCIVVGVVGALAGMVVFDRVNGLTLGADFIPIPRIFVAAWMLFVMLLAIPYLVTGIGLIRLQPWARTLGTVVFTCGMVSVPFGTVLGIYGLHMLTSPEVDEVFSPRFSRDAAPRQATR